MHVNKWLWNNCTGNEWQYHNDWKINDWNKWLKNMIVLQNDCEINECIREALLLVS